MTRASKSRLDVVASLKLLQPWLSRAPDDMCGEIWAFATSLGDVKLTRSVHRELYFKSGDSVSVAFTGNTLHLSMGRGVLGLRGPNQGLDFAWKSSAEIVSVCGVLDGFVTALSDGAILWVRYQRPSVDVRLAISQDVVLGTSVPTMASGSGNEVYINDRTRRRIVRVDLDTNRAIASPAMPGLPAVSHEFAVHNGVVFAVQMLDSRIICWDSEQNGSKWCEVTRAVSKPRGLCIGLRGRCLYVSCAETSSVYRILIDQSMRVDMVCEFAQAKQMTYSPALGLVTMINTHANRVETWKESNWASAMLAA